ncbi:MAG: class I SAM-dependent methyltransferase, partial [Methanomicrobiales archaeon]|nr:class I SAM-dependent methyltransferase [Methanomicrobiales archaeon]
MDNIWEKVHSQRNWGKYPNEELVRFIGRNFFHLPKSERNNIKILEIGCGQGANLWFLSREGFNVFGIDISESAIKKTRDTLKEWNIEKVTLDVQDALDINFPDAFFDVVIDCESISCLKFHDHLKVFRKIKDILKDGGFFWSSHFSDGCWGYDKGTTIDYKTIDNICEGPLQNLNTMCFP